MPRLFVALEIPKDAATALSFMREGLPSARWIDPENYHLTLRFIGDVEGPVADEIVGALDTVVRPGFELALEGLHLFGSKKPHSLYAGVAGPPDLYDLQADLERALRRVGLPPDQRKFTPHVTLARLRHPKDRDVARYLALRGHFRTHPFRVTRFGLFSAKESVGGGPYILEEAFALPASGGSAVPAAGATADGHLG